MEIEELVRVIRQRIAYGAQAADLGDLVAAHGSDLVYLAYTAARYLENT